MDWIVWFLSLLGVLGLIVLLFYALKKLNKRVSIGTGSKLRVLDRVNLGRDGMLLVVSVDGKLMLIGVTPQRVEKLCDLESTEEEYLSGGETQDFKSVLASVLWKKPQSEQSKNAADSQTETQGAFGSDSAGDNGIDQNRFGDSEDRDNAVKH